MSATYRGSQIRFAAGIVLAAAGLGILLFLLPDASQKELQTQKSLHDAMAGYDRQLADLQRARQEADRIKADRQVLDNLLSAMPSEDIGRLNWQLSRALYDLARKHAVRLLYVKYGAPARDTAKGSLLESVDAEFNATGLYPSLKAFMLALESSRLPFAVVGAKLEEVPDGVRLTVTLRAFHQAPAAPRDAQAREGA